MALNVDLCRSCGYTTFPNRFACPSCHKTEFDGGVLDSARLQSVTTGRDGVVIGTLEIDHGDAIVARIFGDLILGDTVPVSTTAGIAGTAYVPNGDRGAMRMHSARSVGLQQQTVPHVLDRQARLYGDKALVRFAGESWSYADAKLRAAGSSGGLRKLGVFEGDSFAVLCGNRPEFLELVLGAAWGGAAIVPINTAARGAGLRHVLTDSKSRVLFVEGALTEILTEDSVPENLEQIVLLDEVGSEEVERLSALSAVRQHERLGPEEEPADVGPHSVLAVLYTSGTTGMPKGVLCPHAQFYWFGISVGELLELDDSDVLLTTLPLFHTNALTAVFQTMLAGATLVVEERFSASRYWDQVVDNGVTCGYLLGAMIAILYSRDRVEYREGHRMTRVLAPSTPPSLAHRFIDEFGVGIVDSYASTETNALLGSLASEYRAGYMGKLGADYEARVVDADGIDVEDGVPGELLCRPKAPFAFSRGYIGNDSATAAAFADLWFHTGDRVVREAGGWYRFVDRMKDTIRRRGENISSLELESAVLAHEAVASAAAFAVPSDLAEDDVMVAVTLRGGASLNPEELVDFLDGRVPYFAIPRYVEVMDALPATENGKISKARLRDRGVTVDTWDGGDVRRR